MAGAESQALLLPKRLCASVLDSVERRRDPQQFAVVGACIFKARHSNDCRRLPLAAEWLSSSETNPYERMTGEKRVRFALITPSTTHNLRLIENPQVGIEQKAARTRNRHTRESVRTRKRTRALYALCLWGLSALSCP
jgi:hypothetical protein